MSIEVEVVVAGAVGDLVASMFEGLVVVRRPPSTVLVADEASLASLLERLSVAGAELVSVVAVPTPQG